MIFSDLVGIIADDLTGANDTALQFHQKGANTKILLDSECAPKVKAGTEVWALSSESRNVPVEVAVSRVERAVATFVENFSFDYYYKKIDSTLRGHIALETLTVLNILDYDAAIIIPAFPQEGRITVGGYHLAKGVPIGKTEIARRLARLVKAPFVKVEATKFTEVGYVGRDVESIIELATYGYLKLNLKAYVNTNPFY